MQDEQSFKQEVDAALRFADQYEPGLKPILVDHYLRWTGGASKDTTDGVAEPTRQAATQMAFGRPGTVAELARQVKPKSGPEHLLVAASFLEQQTKFEKGWGKDALFASFTDMRFKPSNPHDVVTKAKHGGLLMEADGGFLLTQTGISAFEKIAGGQNHG